MFCFIFYPTVNPLIDLFWRGGLSPSCGQRVRVVLMLDRRQDTTGRVKLVGNTTAEAEVSNSRNPKDPLKKEIRNTYIP